LPLSNLAIIRVEMHGNWWLSVEMAIVIFQFCNRSIVRLQVRCNGADTAGEELPSGMIAV